MNTDLEPQDLFVEYQHPVFQDESGDCGGVLGPPFDSRTDALERNLAARVAFCQALYDQPCEECMSVHADYQPHGQTAKMRCDMCYTVCTAHYHHYLDQHDLCQSCQYVAIRSTMLDGIVFLRSMTDADVERFIAEAPTDTTIPRAEIVASYRRSLAFARYPVMSVPNLKYLAYLHDNGTEAERTLLQSSSEAAIVARWNHK